MQAENETPIDFLKRSDALALALQKNVQDLTEVLGVSRASLFSYRTGKRPITSKAWRKLEQAERAAGMLPPSPTYTQEAVKQNRLRERHADAMDDRDYGPVEEMSDEEMVRKINEMQEMLVWMKKRLSRSREEKE